jgi:hypothetical protein
MVGETSPADGPNGDFLSRAAHFSTMLLFDRVKGPAARMEFAKGSSRATTTGGVDDERAMYDVDGSATRTTRSSTIGAAGSSGCSTTIRPRSRARGYRNFIRPGA